MFLFLRSTTHMLVMQTVARTVLICAKLCRLLRQYKEPMVKLHETHQMDLPQGEINGRETLVLVSGELKHVIATRGEWKTNFTSSSPMMIFLLPLQIFWVTCPYLLKVNPEIKWKLNKYSSPCLCCSKIMEALFAFKVKCPS